MHAVNIKKPKLNKSYKERKEEAVVSMPSLTKHSPRASLTQYFRNPNPDLIFFWPPFGPISTKVDDF